MTFSKRFKIGNRWIGEKETAFIVAEIGLNHNGQFEIAKQMIAKAKECGVDAVKFQKRTVRKILTKNEFDRPYNGENSYGSTYGEHRLALELSEEDYVKLKAFADEIGITFFASVWDEDAADFMDKLGTPAFKIASADLTNIPLIRHVAKKHKPILLSTGMSTPEEIANSVNELRNAGVTDLVLMHCVSTYPTKFADLNFSFMQEMEKEFGCLVGYSAHTLCLWDAPVAVALGARVIEKHFTLNRAMKGSDHAASLEAGGLTKVVRDVREFESSWGQGRKYILEDETPIRKKLGKSIVARRDIKRGEMITEDMLAMKSPACGHEGWWIDHFLNKQASRDIMKDEYLKEGDVF